VDALLVLIIDIQLPGLHEGMLKAGAGLDGIRTVVMGIDDRSLLVRARRATGVPGVTARNASTQPFCAKSLK